MKSIQIKKFFRVVYWFAIAIWGFKSGYYFLSHFPNEEKNATFVQACMVLTVDVVLICLLACLGYWFVIFTIWVYTNEDEDD